MRSPDKFLGRLAVVSAYNSWIRPGRMKLPLPARIPIIYAILMVLILVGVLPLYFYATNVVDTNRDRLQRNEKLLQNTVTVTLAEDIAQREREIRAKLTDLTYSIRVTSGGNLEGDRVESTGLQGLLQNSIGTGDSMIAFARLLNKENRYIEVNSSDYAKLVVDAF